jgi:hypothetical protein
MGYFFRFHIRSSSSLLVIGIKPKGKYKPMLASTLRVHIFYILKKYDLKEIVSQKYVLKVY